MVGGGGGGGDYPTMASVIPHLIYQYSPANFHSHVCVKEDWVPCYRVHVYFSVVFNFVPSFQRHSSEGVST